MVTLNDPEHPIDQADQSPSIVSLYTSWTKGFQPSSTSSFNPNGELFKPERSTQYEIGMKTFFFDNRVSATLAWFHLTRENLVTPNPDPALALQGFAVQTGEQRSQGIELDVTAQLTPGWNIVTGYAFWISATSRPRTTVRSSSSSVSLGPCWPPLG